MDWHGLFSGCIPYPHVEQNEQVVFIGESAFVLGPLTELAMHRINGIGGANHTANARRIFEVYR